MDKGDWWATVHGVTKSWTWLEQLSTHAHKCLLYKNLFTLQKDREDAIKIE